MKHEGAAIAQRDSTPQIVERANSVPRPPRRQRFADEKLLVAREQMLPHAGSVPRAP
jgi:hypothetical protein